LIFLRYFNFLTVEMAPPAGDLPRRLVCRCAESATAKAPEVRYGLSTMVDEFTVGSVAQHLQSLQKGGTVRSLQQDLIWGGSMKKLAVAITAVAAFTGSAIAADMPVKARYIAPIAPVVTAYNWTGCYVGVGGGYGMYNQDISADTSGFISGGGTETVTLGGRGWLGTGQVGCDYQFAPQWVIGVFGDYDLSSIKGHIFGVDEKLSSSWAAGGRVGYVIMPNLLTYVSGGYTQAHFDAITCTGCSTNVIDAHTYSGWFLGSGYEYGLTWASPNLFWKTEYRFSSYKKDTLQVLDFCGDGCDGTLDSQKWVQTIRSELVWRFNWH
jgi:outer membrane immunogenic protein